MKTKICTKCKVEKSLDEFGDRKDCKSGKRAQCKSCRTKSARQYEINTREYRVESRKQWRHRNKEHVNKYNRQWSKDHPESRHRTWAKQESKRRMWESPLPINEFFENSELHHLHLIDEETGEVDHRVSIFIPREIHRAVWHSNKIQSTMDEINKLAMEWYNGYRLSVN